jgi:ABC-type multidrug transport system ATPase subunit
MDKGKIIAQGKPAELRKKLQPGTALYVEIGGASKAKASELLSAIPSVESVDAEGSGFVVHVKPNAEIRGEISARVVSAGYTLLEMRGVTSSLESIFLEIVGD